MSEIKIRKDDNKYFNIFFIQHGVLFINNEEGEGMQIGEPQLYDILKQYFKDNM